MTTTTKEVPQRLDAEHFVILVHQFGADIDPKALLDDFLHSEFEYLFGIIYLPTSDDVVLLNIGRDTAREIYEDLCEDKFVEE